MNWLRDYSLAGHYTPTPCDFVRLLVALHSLGAKSGNIQRIYGVKNLPSKMSEKMEFEKMEFPGFSEKCLG